MEEPQKLGAVDLALLEDWRRTRGPLFEDPAAAVCRIVALDMVSLICYEGRTGAMRIRAARVLEEATARLPASNREATRDQYARASMALIDIRRLDRLRQTGEDFDFRARIRRVLNQAVRCKDDLTRLRTLALAELVAATLGGESGEIQMRAARTILARTREAARRVGRERPQSEQSRPAQPDLPEDERSGAETASSAPDPSDRYVPPPSGGGRPAQQSYECSATPGGRGPP